MTHSRIKPEQGLDRRAIRFRLAAISVVAATLVASFLYAPWVSDGPVMCVSRLMVGIPCPSCGLTRSFCAMSHGAVGEAFQFHAFGPLLFGLCALAIPIMAAELWRGRRFELVAKYAFSSRAAWSLAILFAGYHITRLVLEGSSGELLASMQHSVCGDLWGELSRR